MKLRVLMVTLTLSAGCSSLVDEPSGVVGAEKIYLTNKATLVRRDELHRYSCINGKTATCHCTGRVGRQCLCRCPL